MNKTSTDHDMEQANLLRPRLFFKDITFSDGTTIQLDEDDIVVFVGPNNAGKSAALRDLETWIATSNSGLVVKAANLTKIGTQQDLLRYLDKTALKSGANGQFFYGGIGFNIHHTHVQFFDQHNRQPVANFFARRLSTESRIQDSNAAQALALFHAPPTHPIHMLLMNPALAKDISDKFKHGFGKDLTPFRAGGSSFPLYVGQKPVLREGNDELSKEFIDSLLESNVALDSQGDGMRSFASVLLHVLAGQTHSVQFLDEPEAFLHPPQAKLLGRYIAQNRSSSSQLFISTHSSDVLHGLIEGGSNKVRIVRIRREGSVNKIRELNKEDTKKISNDPLASFSGVFDGIFFEHVIICESDSDCLFYQSLLNLPAISGDRRPDVLFVHTSGKHRMANLTHTLRSLDVPVSVIADIDILREENAFRVLFEQLGGEWPSVSAHWKAISDAVNKQRPPLTAEQVKGMITEILEDVSGVKPFPDFKERDIKAVFKTVSPWGSMKQSGRSALPAGESIKHYDLLNIECSRLGLWIVPVGEIEGFCRSIGGHGPGFVEKVLEERAIDTDPELAEARSFIANIWSRAKV